jgi:hypothetical protein
MNHNTRHTWRIPPVRTRTSLYASYFIPSSVQLWNQQPENIKSSRSVQIIKSNQLIGKLMVWIYLSLVALWRGQCSRKWAVVSVALHWQNGEFTISLYASYFIPSSVQLWNQQPENIKSSRSVQIIKSNLQLQNNTSTSMRTIVSVS